MIKSPFYVVQEFISPLNCENLIDACNFNVPDLDPLGNPAVTSRRSDYAQSVIYDRLQKIMPDLQKHYEFKYKGMEPVTFEWLSEGCSTPLVSNNSEYVRGKWLRTRARDFSAVLFMSDYQENTPFEQEYEVYGGKLEFPQHQFGFNPVRGTLVIFPSDPHFISATAPVRAGDLYQAKIHFVGQTPYVYQPANFPGDYAQWFKPLLINN